MPNILEDNGWTLATEHLPARLSAPFPNVNTLYLLEQDMMQNEANYVPLALNTNHPTLPAYKLVEERLINIEAGARTWTRVYAQVPASWSEPLTFAYNYIGWGGSYVVDGRFPGGLDPTSTAGRPRKVRTVSGKRQFDYFLIGFGGTYASHEFIPLIQETKYRNPGNTYDVDFLWDAPPFSSASVPSLATYKTWVTLDAATGDSFSLVVQTSEVTRWKGQIFQRETKYIKAL